jgi:hypothetical protein
MHANERFLKRLQEIEVLLSKPDVNELYILGLLDGSLIVSAYETSSNRDELDLAVKLNQLALRLGSAHGLI